MNLHDIIKKSRNSEMFTREEITGMLALQPNTLETYVIMAESSRIVKTAGLCSVKKVLMDPLSLRS